MHPFKNRITGKQLITPKACQGHANTSFFSRFGYHKGIRTISTGVVHGLQSSRKQLKKIRRMAGDALYRLKPGVAAGKIRAALGEPYYSFGSNFAYTRRVLLEEQIQVLLNEPQDPFDELIASLLNGGGKKGQILSAISRAEIGSYMQNVLLRDADQMSMAHALELRVPFLDYRLVEYVLSVPDHIKYPHSKKKLLIDSLPHHAMTTQLQ